MTFAFLTHANMHPLLLLLPFPQTAVRWMVSNFMANRNCMLGDEVRVGEALCDSL